MTHFTVHHVMINDIHGQFNEIADFINFDSSDKRGTSMDIKTETASIFTRIEPRDNHIRSSDFFDVGNIPIFFPEY